MSRGKRREEKNDAFSRSTSDGRLGPTSNAQRYAAGCVFFLFFEGDLTPHVDGPRKCDEIPRNLSRKKEQSGEMLLTYYIKGHYTVA